MEGHSSSDADKFFDACREGVMAELYRCVQRDPYVTGAKAADGTTGLWVAAEQGHSDIVHFLLTSGADPNANRETDRVTAVYIAAQNGHAKTVAVLCEAGAEVNARKASGASPLYIAAQQGSVEVVRILLAHGAEANKRCGRGLTPLMIAAYQRNDACVAELLHHGADPWMKAQGHSALDWAVAVGYGAEFSKAIPATENPAETSLTLPLSSGAWALPEESEEVRRVNAQWTTFKLKVFDRAGDSRP